MKSIKPMGNKKKLAKLADKYVAQNVVNTVGGGDNESYFPQPVYSATAKDMERSRAVAIERALLNNRGFHKEVSERDISTVQDVLDKQQQARWQYFISNIYNIKDPAQRQMLLETFPEWAEMRNKLVRQNAELQVKMGEIQNTGASTREDWEFLFGLLSGAISIPEKPIYDPAGYYTKGRYTKGPFAPAIRNPKIKYMRQLNESLGFSKWFNAGATGDVDVPWPEANPAFSDDLKTAVNKLYGGGVPGLATTAT